MKQILERNLGSFHIKEGILFKDILKMIQDIESDWIKRPSDILCIDLYLLLVEIDDRVNNGEWDNERETQYYKLFKLLQNIKYK